MTAYTAVLLYVAWMIALVMVYAGPRIPLALMGRRNMTSWERNQPVQDAPFYQRAKAAHLNCLENFPLFAAVVAVAGLSGKLAAVDTLAGYVLYLRIAQGATHMIGATAALISIRAGFFAAQQVLVLWMVWNLLH